MVCVRPLPKLSDIPDDQRTPLVLMLLEFITWQHEEILRLKDEIAILKGQKPRPKIKPSKLEEGTRENQQKEGEPGKRPGSAKRSKTEEVTDFDVVNLSVENVPHGSAFKGYEDYMVQELIIESRHVLYRRERWIAPDGTTIVAPLPKDVEALKGGHFNRAVNAAVLSLHHKGTVTQPLIRDMLTDWGIDISTGQINRILTEDKQGFHEEKQEILRVGLEVSSYVNADDTGARHQGKNGYCTHIGNELFAWFESTTSKSRINFLELLRAGNTDYVINETVIDYLCANNLSEAQINSIIDSGKTSFATEKAWKAALESWDITNTAAVRIATEGALLGSVLEHGINPHLAVISDDAGQFNILLHGLCWVHAERTIHKIVGFTDEHREALEAIRGQIWDFYKALKSYRKSPSPDKKAELSARFDEIFTQETCFVTLNQALKRLYSNKAELLLVLDRPDIPLHNNASESDIREYVKRRKISGGTRSDEGRKCRDTFTSLKKTCGKLGVRFWHYINDRLGGTGEIPPLSELMRQRAAQAMADPA